MIAPARLSTRLRPEEVADSIPFETEDLILQPGAPTRKYIPGEGRSLPTVKFGQLKLLVSEIQFLTFYWEPQIHRTPICVYLGGAPGSHIRVLADLFPQVSFHLYDTQTFSVALSQCPNVYIYQQYFRDEDMAAYRDVSELFLISDIRSLSYQQAGSYKAPLHNEEPGPNKGALANEEVTWTDMRLQERWVKELRPVAALLKFRLPYDFDAVRNKIGPTWRYLDGIIYLQPWAGRESTEARLVVPRDWKERDYDYGQYEQMLAYHNIVTRAEKVYRSPLDPTSSVAMAAEQGYTNDYDSTATAVVLQLYLEKIGVRPNSDKVTRLMGYLAIFASGNSQRTLRSLRVGAPEPDDE